MKTYCIIGGCGIIATILAVALADDARPRRVLVLANEDTVTGQIIEGDGKYRVVEGSGERIFAASRVLKVCDSLEDAYAYLRGRANVRDPDEHVRLARWCERNKLWNQAREEAEAALKLRTNDEEAQRVLRSVLAQTPTKARPSAKPAETPPSKPATTVALQDHSYKPETLVEYTRRIQPILMNGCGLGSCHGNNNRGTYELTRPPSSGTLSAMQTKQNLVRTLALVDREEVENSPLLRKALETHGGAVKPPLGSRDAAAYKAVEAWVKTLGPAKPAEKAIAGATGETAPPAESLNPGSSGFASERDDQPAKPSPKAEAPTAPPAKPSVKPSAPTTDFKVQPEPPSALPDEQVKPVTPKAAPKVIDTEDPFDPGIFNRQFHPKKM